jgi:alkylresorcinol/alkylpyrone synthase
MEEYHALDGFGDRNRKWVEVGLPMAEAAARGVLEQADLDIADIGLITSTTVTGLSVPSLEALLMNRLPFAPTTRRMPLFGLGCLGGVAGVNRVVDYLRGHPQEAALLLSLELCSLTLQKDDLSVANIIATGLFGDGAAAVLMLGDEHPLAEQSPLAFEGNRSAFFPGTERYMGWDIVDSGFKVILAPTIPRIVAEQLPREIDALLAQEGLDDEAPRFFVGHPGGPKILEATAAALGLDNGGLQKSWDSLARYGNMSSASVLFVLADTLADLPEPGTLGLMYAVGPAFCAELALLRSTAAARGATPRPFEPVVASA